MNTDQCVLSAVISVSVLFFGFTVCPNTSLNCLASCCLTCRLPPPKEPCFLSVALCGSKHTQHSKSRDTAKKRIPYRTYGPELQRDTVNEGNSRRCWLWTSNCKWAIYFGKPKDGSHILLHICPQIMNKISQWHLSLACRPNVTFICYTLMCVLAAVQLHLHLVTHSDAIAHLKKKNKTKNTFFCSYNCCSAFQGRGKVTAERICLWQH